MDVWSACWNECLLEKKNRKIGIEINLKRIMGWDLCKINKHFLQFAIKLGHYHVDHLTHDILIYRKNLFNFFPRFLNTHLGNTLLVDDMPYRTCLNPPCNAIYVESYEYMPKENYLMKTLLPYLKFFHYFGLSLPTFVELYPFNAIKSMKEDDVRFRMLFKKCTMVYLANFCKNRSTSIVSSPNIFFCLFLPMLFWIFQSHWFLWLIYFRTFTIIICLFFQIISAPFLEEAKDKEEDK
jgi:hypothetical protein